MKFYITTAIDYVNQRPHLGTAYEKIGADCMARYKRLCGYDTYFLMGNDEHSTNVEREAKRKGLDTFEYCRRMSKEFQDVWKELSISYDDFIHTTEQRHITAVSTLFERIHENGYIYKGAYEGLYCESCEEFISEKDLVEGLCPRHKQQPVAISEENYFFALSRFEDRLLEHIAENPGFISPKIRENEVVNVIKGGLEDVSISRAGKSWGIPLPIDAGHVIYVWFDALTNYISALGYGADGDLFDRYWPADVHVIGKDITRFHCVIWPAMLMAGGVEPPRSIFAHGFISLGGEKMSKTRGNILDPSKMAGAFGPDGLRYLLMREVPFDRDGDISVETLLARYNADLANELGNLFSRTVAMISKYLSGSIDPRPFGDGDELYGGLSAAIEGYRTHMERMEFSRAIGAFWPAVQRANRFIEETKPWELAKDEGSAGALETVFANLLAVLVSAGVLLGPFMPAAMARMLEHLGAADVRIDDLPPRSVSARGLEPPKPLFPRIQADPSELFEE
ncbi:MAG TPA: methionine--tRNA ligase [Candidatus Eisenbacteria bacterium]|uniref:Methionine--tRNA ligase n=1 Tax=Eiseniibacteriota bacterium TaxID=2212470 RepID=A0A7V2F3L2_UNCEI|nr:methionine--tRNA ligase [Candidatus Eisenbacteria bacterium]